VSRVTRKEWYERVNAAWPKDVPPLTGGEAIRAAGRLWRWARGYTFAGEIRETSGNRYTWTSRGVLLVNPSHGWKRFIHDLSHLFWQQANRDQEVRPHEKGHGRLELRMIKEVLRRGWLDGRLRSEPRPAATRGEITERRYRAVLSREETWSRKLARAENALRKVRRQRRYYEAKMAREES